MNEWYTNDKGNSRCVYCHQGEVWSERDKHSMRCRASYYKNNLDTKIKDLEMRVEKIEVTLKVIKDLLMRGK